MFVSFLLNRTQLLDSFHQLFTASSLNPEQKEIATARTEFFAYSIPDETEEVSLLFPLKLNIHNSNRWVDNNHLILLLSFRFCAAIGQTTCSHVIGHVFPFWTIHWSSLQFLMVVWFSLLWLAQSQEVRDAITILILYLAMIKYVGFLSSFVVASIRFRAELKIALPDPTAQALVCFVAGKTQNWWSTIFRLSSSNQPMMAL